MKRELVTTFNAKIIAIGNPKQEKTINRPFVISFSPYIFVSIWAFCRDESYKSIQVIFQEDPSIIKHIQVSIGVFLSCVRVIKLIQEYSSCVRVS